MHKNCEEKAGMGRSGKSGNKRKKLLVLLAAVASLVLICFASVLGINAYVKKVGGSRILSAKEAEELTDCDCILVLGCKVWENGTPSHMLEDRLKRGIELYDAGVAPKLLMSGDHGRKDYDEVRTMKDVAMEAGIASSDIFKDHAGFSTYESMYRAKEIFGADKIVIVTQEYHLYRALYIANALGIEAYGVPSDYRTYVGQRNRDVREILARNKDFFTSIFKPKPTYLGDFIPIDGDGDLTEG